MEFVTQNFVPILFTVIFGGMALIGLSLNLFARLKWKMQLVLEAIEAKQDPEKVKVPIFPFILKLSSLAYLFNTGPNFDENPELFEIPAVYKIWQRINGFTKFYFFAVPFSFFLLIVLVVLAGLAGE